MSQAAVCLSPKNYILHTAQCPCMRMLSITQLDIYTCCGSPMFLQFSSFTCSKNLTASHTKSSGMFSKFTLSTLLWTRLPAGWRVSKRALSIVTVPLQDQHYIYIFDKSCITRLELHGLCCWHSCRQYRYIIDKYRGPTYTILQPYLYLKGIIAFA